MPAPSEEFNETPINDELCDFVLTEELREQWLKDYRECEECNELMERKEIKFDILGQMPLFNDQTMVVAVPRSLIRQAMSSTGENDAETLAKRALEMLIWQQLPIDDRIEDLIEIRDWTRAENEIQ